MSNTLNTDENLTRRAREVFTASVAGLDAGTLARLRAARLKALEAAEHPLPRWQQLGWRLPAGAVALVFVAVVGGFLITNPGPATPDAASPFAAGNNEDAPVVTAGDNLDMYADMDFYQWMAAQGQPAKPVEPAADSDDDDDSGVGG
ncbi:MAG TPA: hypothetical protein VFK21_05605 [Gammaproteobacteria bacterium]|nr:hypothetical protein [Gammaproteobacteria bacterium]